MIFQPLRQGVEVLGAPFSVSPSNGMVKINYYLDHPAGIKNHSNEWTSQVARCLEQTCQVYQRAFQEPNRSNASSPPNLPVRLKVGKIRAFKMLSLIR
mmetsp:Transcript_4129/g.26080  ORF Transcript_4129/g.26080 Transcript_4129/m.26080 type:complete len:98 (-) Transcript_4129:115-408(-)